MAKVNYLNNKDLLEEIHKSKTSYCSFVDPTYSEYDIILPSLDKINLRTIVTAKKNKAKKMSIKEYEIRKVSGDKKVKLSECEVPYKKIDKTDLIFRIMTFDHVPLAPGRKKKTKTVADLHEKVNFPPFQHWKFNDDGELICVGKSHWVGGMENGYFSKEHGKFTNKLAKMFMKLCERYGTRSNVRGYCVDTETEALTQRGWIGIAEINDNDTILSYYQGSLTWSRILSIYRGEYNGLMHKITTKTGVDMLITPEHKLVTPRGLVPVELIKEDDKIILLGEAVQNNETIYSDSLVELAGWIVTVGHYVFNKSNSTLRAITLWQNEGPCADRVRTCLNQLGYKFSERSNLQYTNKCNVCFRISSNHSREFAKILPTKNLSMNFILSLTTKQRELLLETMIDGDGCGIGKQKKYVQKSKEHIDLFQILCTLVGHRSTTHYIQDKSAFGKTVNYYNVNIFSKRKNQTNGSYLDFNGGKRNGRNHPGQGKINHPNEPTVPYNGWVWCPETEYGCFVARRNGTIYLTSNTYNDEMRGQAILQLTQIGLQFDESKSNNPFAYYTAAVTNSFVRVINIEKKNQNIRDDILEMNNLTPSYTRQSNHEWQLAVERHKNKD